MTAEQLPDVPLPSPAERQGDPGHDQSLDRANAIRLLTLRAQGLSYAQIAEAVGYSDGSGARQALMRALDRHEAESVQQLRTIENLRMDADERALRGIIADPQASVKDRIAAVNARTRLGARRSRMNGLDAPMQVLISGDAENRLQDVLADATNLVMGLVTHSEVLPPEEPAPTWEA